MTNTNPVYDNQIDEDEIDDDVENEQDSANDLDESSGSCKQRPENKMILIDDLVQKSEKKKEDPRKDFVDKFFQENLGQQQKAPQPIENGLLEAPSPLR